MSLPLNVDLIPEEMKALKNWVLWKLEERDGKNTKIPYQTNGKRANSANPDTWNIFEVVEQAFIRRKNKFSGLGFVFSEDTGIIGIDWDKVRDPETGKWNEEILEEIKNLNSYAELSQSGTGAHVLIKGKIPGDRRRKGNIEMYSKERFFVVTGSHIEGSPVEIGENQEDINKLYKKRFDDKEPKKTDRKLQPEKKIKLSDSEIIEIASRAKNSATFKSLYSGSISGYASQSEADLALCSIFAFYTQDESQIDELFRGSGLYRDKWERDDYKQDTINKAIQGITETYNPERKGDGKRKSDDVKSKKINVPFDVVADYILNNNRIFSMRDNKQIYLYQDGVYKNEGTEAILDTKARNIHNEIYEEYWNDVNPNFPLSHIQKATTRYVTEVLNYVRAYSHISRRDIDIEAGKYLNLQNGLFDLEKWEFKEHTPEYLSICQTPVKYDTNAKCPQIETFLSEVAKLEDIDFIYEWFGYCLTVDVKYQKALMVYGIPGTGKSVLLALLEMFIGIENCSAEGLQKIEEDKYRAANLYGKRVNVCSDIPSTKMHKTEVFKKMVSGLDSIDAENKYQQPFKFRNVAKLAFSANKLPEGPKDPAFYERFCLIEFCNKFRGTDKDDKQLINKLTTEAELSGLLNKALEGLKGLYQNDKFSYSKTFEETEKEYLLNSNPVAVFMEECTVISNDDIEGTKLYLAYVDWSSKKNLTRVSNIEFSRKLIKMGYTNHRENEKGSYCTKKVNLWDNLNIKVGQDLPNLGQDQSDTSCPNENDQPMIENHFKPSLGQNLTPIVVGDFEDNSYYCENIETVQREKNANNEKLENNRNISCPTSRFFNSRSIGQDVLPDPILDPVLEQKTLVFEQNEDEDSRKNLSGSELMRCDLKNFARSQYNLIVDNIHVFVGEFNKEFPNYKQKYGLQAVLSNAERLSSRGWK